MIEVGILGANGRMGAFVRQLLSTDYAQKARSHREVSGGDDLALLLNCDVVIDFSSADAIAELARLALKSEQERLPAFVIGSTGWKPGQVELIEELASKTPVLMSSNFSTGVFLLKSVLEKFTAELLRMGYLPSMVETHHVHKKDAPSGTALLLNRAIEAASKAPVPTQSIRTGEVIGDHEAVFQGPADTLTFSHRAKDRSVFARGAIDVAIWLSRKRTSVPTKILSMDDYLSDLRS